MDSPTIDLDQLWKSYRQTAQVEARDQLIMHYLPLVKVVVGRISASYPAHIKMDDLYSSGVTGLIKAVEKFDPERPTRFEGYAMWLIKGAIIDELRELDWIPRSVHQKSHLIKSAQSILQQELGREPSDEELAVRLGISEEEFQTTLEKVRPAVLIPLNAPITSQEDEALPISEKIADVSVEDSFHFADRKEFKALLEKEIASLSDKEQKVLMLYYFDEYMLKEIGQELGISESRVSQIHTKALLKLRGRLENLLMMP